jgi:hypothetical protein
MGSEWIKHVKRYAKSNGITYGEALKKARSTYKSTAAPKKTVRRKKASGYVGRSNKPMRQGRQLRGEGRRPIKLMRDKNYRSAYMLGGIIGDEIMSGGAAPKGALAALLSGLDARVNIK